MHDDIAELLKCIFGSFLNAHKNKKLKSISIEWDTAMTKVEMMLKKMQNDIKKILEAFYFLFYLKNFYVYVQR